MGKYNLQFCMEHQKPLTRSEAVQFPLHQEPLKSLKAFHYVLPHILKSVSDGSDNFTAQSPGSPFCHDTSLREQGELSSPVTLMSVKGTDSLFHPPRSHPLSLQPLSWRLYRVPLRYRATSPYAAHGYGRDTAGAHLPS